MFRKFGVFSFLTAIFLLSVILRWGQITPDVKSHEQTYILTLQTCEIWQHNGIANNHFTPMWTYHNDGDKHMAYYKRLEDEKGNNYYVSFPPFSFLCAYAVTLPFNISYGKVVLQIFNLLLHFITALFIYLILKYLFRKNNGGFHPEAFAGFIIYLFLPSTLYLHTDIFFPEMLGQVLWVISVYILLLFKENPSKKNGVFLIITLMLFLYTEWIAVFFVTGFILASLIMKGPKLKTAGIKAAGISLATVALVMIYQYASIAGTHELIHAMGLRFLERSGFFGETYSSMGVHLFSLESLKLFGTNLYKGFSITGIAISSFLLILFLFKKIPIGTKGFILLMIICFPLLTHWIVFFNANALHLLLMSRVAFPIAIAAGIGVHFILKNKTRLPLKNTLIVSGLLLLTIANCIIYKKHFVATEEAPFLKTAAQKISETATPEEAVFIINQSATAEPEKYLTFMSKRNIVAVDNFEQAEEKANKISINKKFIVFTLKTNLCIPYQKIND